MSANLESRGGGLEIRVHKTPTALVPPSRNVASATALALPNGETQRSNYYRTGERIYLSWGFVLFFPAPAYAAPVTGASGIALWRKRENDEDEPSSQHWKQRSPSPMLGSAYYVYLLSGCTLRHTLTFPMEQILESIKKRELHASNEDGSTQPLIVSACIDGIISDALKRLCGSCCCCRSRKLSHSPRVCANLSQWCSILLASALLCVWGARHTNWCHFLSSTPYAWGHRLQIAWEKQQLIYRHYSNTPRVKKKN